MGNIGGFKSYKPTSKVGRTAAKLGAGAGVGLIAFIIVFYYGPIYSLSTWAPEQPISFSHKLHAGDMKINCQYCHSYARRSEMAGVPALSTCMNCHSNISKQSEPLAKLAKHVEEKKPIEWIRVYKSPEHVWFNHKRHIKKDIACQECHGPVETMEVMARKVSHKMGFCLKCHQTNEAPTDCWTCHT